MSIKLDDQGCGPGCHQTPIVEVRLSDVTLRDLIVEATRLRHGAKSETDAVSLIGLLEITFPYCSAGLDASRCPRG